MSSTVKSRPGRRVVHRRGTLDRAYDVALFELPPAMRPAMIAWIEARRAEHETRQALSSQMTNSGLCWIDIEAISGELAFAA